MKFCLLLILLLFAGCARTVYVPVPEKHAEYRDRVQIDSVFIRDSVAVLTTGDTVYIYRDRWRDRIHNIRDTVSIHDSIPYPVVVEKPVRHVPAIYRWSLWVAIAAAGWGIWKMRR